MRVQRHANVSKQATLLDGLDVSPLKWRVCGCGLNRFVHEGMDHISNVKVHLKTRSGNVNIKECIPLTITPSCLSFNVSTLQCNSFRKFMKHVSTIQKHYEPRHEISNHVVCATSKASDHTRSLITAFASRLYIP